MRMTVAAPAKINLFLDITGKRNDGYHLINTVMQSVSLYDDVTVSTDENSNEVNVSCNDPDIPCDGTNTVSVAVREFFEYTQLTPLGINIRIKKRIPSQAGMAGGSTDAAAVIYALNNLLNAGLTTEEMAEIGEKVGADVPFCINGGTISATGIGTIFSPLPDMPDCTFVAVKPGFRISTREAYEKSDIKGYDSPKSPDAVIDAICNGSIEGIAKNMYNKFEDVMGIQEIEQIKDTMKNCGALGALMTGSGSVVFSVFDDEGLAQDCRDELKKNYENVYIFNPVSYGPRQINLSLFGTLFD